MWRKVDVHVGWLPGFLYVKGGILRVHTECEAAFVPMRAHLIRMPADGRTCMRMTVCGTSSAQFAEHRRRHVMLLVD